MSKVKLVAGKTRCLMKIEFTDGFEVSLREEDYMRVKLCNFGGQGTIKLIQHMATGELDLHVVFEPFETVWFSLE